MQGGSHHTLGRRTGRGRHTGRSKSPAIKAGRRQNFHMLGRQLIDETRRHRRLPLTIDPAVRGKRNRANLLRPGNADIGQSPLFFETLHPAFIHRPLGRKQPIFPSGQEYCRKLQPFGGMQCHDRHFLFRVLAFIVHDQADMFEETLKVFKILQGFHQFLEVLQPPGRLRCFVVLPKPCVAALIKDHLSQLDMSVCLGPHLSMPTV